MKNLSVGLIGYGLGGQAFHAPFIDATKGLQLSLIRETKPERIKLIRQRYPATEIVSSTEELLMDEDIDVVVITTPNEFHFSLARHALLAGKHVVVDKPFTITTKEAEILIKLSQKVDKKITIYQNRRWDSDFRTVHKIVQHKTLGQLVEVEIHFDRYRPAPKESWKETSRPGNGILYDLGPHLIDQALVLFGLPKEIQADIRVQRDKGQAPDYFELQFFYPNLKVILKAGNLVAAPVPHYILHGTAGSFIKYGLDVQEAALRNGTTPQNEPLWGQEPEELWGTFYRQGKKPKKIESETGDYGIFYQNLIHAIIDGKPLAVKPEEAKQVVSLIEMAQLSSGEKRRFLIS